MSGRRTVGAIGKLLAAFVLGLTAAFAVVLFTNRECESDCSWVADVFFEGNGIYFLLAACWVVGAGLVWAMSQQNRVRVSGIHVLVAAAAGVLSEVVNVAIDDGTTFHVVDAAVIGATAIAVTVVLGAIACQASSRWVDFVAPRATFTAHLPKSAPPRPANGATRARPGRGRRTARERVQRLDLPRVVRAGVRAQPAARVVRPMRISSSMNSWSKNR